MFRNIATCRAIGSHAPTLSTWSELSGRRSNGQPAEYPHNQLWLATDRLGFAPMLGFCGSVLAGLGLQAWVAPLGSTLNSARARLSRAIPFLTRADQIMSWQKRRSETAHRAKA